MSKRAKSRIEADPLNVARGLVSIAINLAEWTKRTNTVSKRAQQVRAMLLKASDPHKVLFADLPTLLEAKDPEEINLRLSEVTDELSGAYHRMLQGVRDFLMAALDHSGRIPSELGHRASIVKGITGDLRLDAFAAHLERIDDSNSVIEGLISLGAGKPAAQWVDRDIDMAMGAMSTWAVDFRKAEAMAPLRNRPSTRRVLGLVFGASHGMDISGYVDIADKDKPSVDRVLRDFLANTMGERPEVILAALVEAGAITLGNLHKGKKNG